MMSETKSLMIPVDRMRAMVRGVWRLLCAAAATGLILNIHLNWALTLKTQPATFLAFGAIYLVLAVAIALLLISTVRWILLAVWPRSLFFKITPEHVFVSTGPFGQRVYDWSRMRIHVEPDIDTEVLDTLPDEALTLHLHHPACREDLAMQIQRLSGLESERFIAMMRPFFLPSCERNDQDQ